MNFELLVASGNKHKVDEIRQILSPHGITVYGIKDLNLKDLVEPENGNTYKENALIKAYELNKQVTMPIIADDSGIEIEALGNKPGLHTARFATEMGGHDKANRFIVDECKKGGNNRATFYCDIVLINVEDKPLLFEGVVKGHISDDVKGSNGFGYDPIFICDEVNKCYAELSNKEKNLVSHRGKALKKLITYLLVNGFISK